MRINWKSLKSRIPPRVRLGKTIYEVVWVSDFKNPEVMGETRFNPPQIAIKNNLTDKNTVTTYIHEITHGVSEEEKLGLTENQVLGLENSLSYILKPDNIFTDKRKRNAKTKQKKHSRRIR